jgi:hypothetical protein
VPNGVDVVRANLLKELLEVVHGSPRLTLTAAYDSCDTHHNGIACLFVDAAVVVGRGCSLLVVLLAPLLPPSSTSRMMMLGDTSLLLVGAG